MADLAQAGFEFDSLTDLRVSGRRYRGAYRYLLRWLPQVSDLVVKEQIVRALSVPWARPAAASSLIEEFRTIEGEGDPTGTGIRWAIGNALSIVGDDSVFEDLAAIAKERHFGKSRQMIVVGLGRSRKPEVVPLLIDLLDDSDLIRSGRRLSQRRPRLVGRRLESDVPNSISL